mgnify:CR=1 FL=1
MIRPIAEMEAFYRSKIFHNKLIKKYSDTVHCAELAMVYYSTLRNVLMGWSYTNDYMLKQVLEEICPKSERKKKGKKRMTIREILLSV